MQNDPTSVRNLALSVLGQMRDSDAQLSQGQKPAGTAKVELAQRVNPTVPLSHALGTGTLGQLLNEDGTPLGTVVGQLRTICVQCGAGPDTDPPSDAPTVHVGDVWLHPECRKFWK